MVFFSSDEAFDHVFENEVREETRIRRTSRKHECQKCDKCYVYVYHRDRHEEQSVPSQISPMYPKQTKGVRRKRVVLEDEAPQTKQPKRIPYFVVICELSSEKPHLMIIRKSVIDVIDCG